MWVAKPMTKRTTPMLGCTVTSNMTNTNTLLELALSPPLFLPFFTNHYPTADLIWILPSSQADMSVPAAFPTIFFSTSERFHLNGFCEILIVVTSAYMCSGEMFYYFDRNRSILLPGTPPASALAVGGERRMREQL